MKQIIIGILLVLAPYCFAKAKWKVIKTLKRNDIQTFSFQDKMPCEVFRKHNNSDKEYLGAGFPLIMNMETKDGEHLSLILNTFSLIDTWVWNTDEPSTPNTVACQELRDKIDSKGKTDAYFFGNKIAKSIDAIDLSDSTYFIPQTKTCYTKKVQILEKNIHGIGANPATMQFYSSKINAKKIHKLVTVNTYLDCPTDMSNVIIESIPCTTPKPCETDCCCHHSCNKK
jgi:hypothetical protein